MTDELSRRAADRRAEQGYTLDELTDSDDPTGQYDTGDVGATLDNLQAYTDQAEITFGDGETAAVIPLVTRDGVSVIVETIDRDPYAGMTVDLSPADARDAAAALQQAAEDAETIHGDRDPVAKPDGGVRSGARVTVTFDADELEVARERLPADADALDARHVLADLADLDEEYRTDDGRDAIAAVLAGTDD